LPAWAAARQSYKSDNIGLDWIWRKGVGRQKRGKTVRIQCPGAVYHVMARGNQGRQVFRDHQDRKTLLTSLGEACARTGWQGHDASGEADAQAAQPEAGEAAAQVAPNHK
jgi:hypothetical protein